MLGRLLDVGAALMGCNQFDPPEGSGREPNVHRLVIDLPADTPGVEAFFDEVALQAMVWGALRGRDAHVSGRLLYDDIYDSPSPPSPPPSHDEVEPDTGWGPLDPRGERMN